MNLTVSFANVEQATKLLLANAAGVEPQRWILWAIPQTAPIEPYGTLFLSDGFSSLTLPSCQVISQQLTYGVNGPQLQVTGLDRRVYWSGQAIDGEYNVRDANGNIVPHTERTPQQLAQLLWIAMGEPFASVSALPNIDRPYVNWQCANAATELDKLCERYGCEPTLDIGTNSSGIIVKGIGQPLPNNLDVRWAAEGIHGVLPTRIEACSGYALLQSKLKLEPILEDIDNTEKNANDVTYAPSGGWDGNVASLEDPLPADSTEENAERAKKLWKRWRVTGFADGTLTHGLLGPVNTVHDLFPISDRLLTPLTNDEGEVLEAGAYLVGTARIDGAPAPLDNTEEGARIDVPFRIIEDKGIIETAEPIYQVTGETELAAAELYLVCTHRMRDPSTNQLVRYVRFFTPGGVGGVQTVQSYDVIPRITTTYGSGASHTIATGYEGNTAALNALLDLDISRKLDELSPRPSAVVEYNGIQYIAADGAIQSVFWILDCNERSDERNCITVGYRNVEGGDLLLYSRERARRQLSVATEIDRKRIIVDSGQHNRRRIA